MTHNPTARHLTWLVDIGLMSILFVLPLLLGGNHPVALFVYLAIVFVTATLWCARQWFVGSALWRRSGVEWWLLLAVGLLIFQLTPLPASVLEKISPETAQLLPLWSSDDGQVGAWTTISLSPRATQTSLIVLLAHVSLFLVIVQRADQIEDLNRMFRWIGVAAICMACIGLIQFLFGNGKYLWVYEHPYQDTHGEVRGSFVNPNHFAHFLALGIAPLVVWLQQMLNTEPVRGRQRQTNHKALPLLVGTGLGLIALAVFLSLSRGGFIVMVVGSMVCVGLLARRGILSGKTVALLGATGVLAGAALFAYGYDRVSGEIASIHSGSLDELDRGGVRRKLWGANLEAATHFPWFGTGAGSHAEVYPTYYEHFADKHYTHTENGYLQTFLEFGAAGLVLLLIAVVIVFVWCYQSLARARSLEGYMLAVVATTGVTISLVQSCGDFVWHSPVCMSVAIFFLASVCRLRQIAKAHTVNEVADLTTASPKIRLGYAAAMMACAGIAVFTAKHQIGPVQASLHWDRYLRLATHPTDTRFSNDSTREMLEHVAQTLRHDPHHVQANLKMSALCLAQFEIAQTQSTNPMPISQLRDAIRGAGFKDIDSQRRWLVVVLGKNGRHLEDATRYARRAIHLCPLQGEAYVNLANVSFLTDTTNQTRNQCLEQALRVRPHGNVVLMACGNAAAESGDVDEAIRFWKYVFRREPKFQQQLIAKLAPQVPAQFFIDRFEPGPDALERLYRTYQNLNRVADAQAIARLFVQHVEVKAQRVVADDAAKHWHTAHGIYYYLKDSGNALRCARAAAGHAPNDVAMRQALGSMLIEVHRFDEAIEQLTWCVRLRPGDPALKRQLDFAIEQKSIIEKNRLVGHED